MREKHTVQRSIFEHYAEHEIGRELKAISDWLDQHMDLLDRVAADINNVGLWPGPVIHVVEIKAYRITAFWLRL